MGGVGRCIALPLREEGSSPLSRVKLAPQMLYISSSFVPAQTILEILYGILLVSVNWGVDDVMR